MHEFSLCRAIASTVEQHADGRAVDVVYVDIGYLRQVVPETLVYCWGLQVADTPLASARLDVNHVPAVIECRDCGSHTTLTVPVRRCETCGSVATDLLSGEEFMVVSIDLGPEPVVTPDPDVNIELDVNPATRSS